VLGVIIGGVFLTILLIGDRREALAKEREKQIKAANTPQEGTWPPPPAERVVPVSTGPVEPSTSVGMHYRRARYWYWVLWLTVRALLVLAVTLAWIYAKFGLIVAIVISVVTVGVVVALAVRKAKLRP
jgi:hypothetical protein